MTLKELKVRVDVALEIHGDRDLEVCIPNNKPAVGPIGATKVKAASAGFDWNSGRFFIWPENKMVEQP